MILIRRAQKLEDYQAMIPHFVVESEAQREELVKELAEFMQTKPQDLFVIQAWKDEVLVGFIVAQNTSPDVVFIVQAWSKAQTFNVIDELYARTINWANANGRTKIDAITKRDVDTLYRRFGFVETGVVVRYEIKPKLTSALVSKIKELMHGKPVQDPEE